MEHINAIFERIETLTKIESDSNFMSMVLNRRESDKNCQTEPNKEIVYSAQKAFLHKIFAEIDQIASFVKNDDNVLISVKNQKLLRTCFQLIVSLGISPSLIPGIGISLSKRCSLASVLPPHDLSDEQKYELLTDCTDFFIRSYSTPVLKNIIISFYMSDYLSALIQLCYAPLKKPGVYTNFTMTKEIYDKLNLDRIKYQKIYEFLVNNCFQPILMKELLILQNVSDQTPPAFVKRVIAKELSRQLITPGGLLSLIRCFIDSHEVDTGLDWKKIDIICKLISTKHGIANENEYLQNICSQLRQILVLNNSKYLTTAVACLTTLIEKYPISDIVNSLAIEVFNTFNNEKLTSESHLPGTIIFTTQEIDHKLQIFHSSLCLPNKELIFKLLTPNVVILFMLGMKCSNDDLRRKLNNILLKCLEHTEIDRIPSLMKALLFGGDPISSAFIVEEFQMGLTVKVAVADYYYPTDEALFYFINLFRESSKKLFVQTVLEAALQMLIEINLKRHESCEEILTLEEDPILLTDLDRKYVNILHLLSVISEFPKITQCLKTCPEIVVNFVEHFLQKNEGNDECETIALILLNTVLPSINNLNTKLRLKKLIPTLERIANKELNSNTILSKEAISLIEGNRIQTCNSAYEKAISNITDNLLPTRAHGVIELTKLIETQDSETISKRHLVFCLLQEQLKNSDSYLYLAAINGIAALAMNCTEDVLTVLCREYLNVSTQTADIETIDLQNKIQELRMKIGDIVVKVTKRLGDICIIHKTILLNTMLTACRDHDPLIRASALSNLAEIALVLHYRIGSIIFEVLLCIQSIIETDKAIECRRAAVMVISSLLKGLGKETLVQLKENLVPMYRILVKLYKDSKEDDIVRLHAQIALEELNDIVHEFLSCKLDMNRPMSLFEESKEIIYK